MKTDKKAFCCWSGGKESALSFYRAKNSGYDIYCLLNMISEEGNHSRTHGIDSCWLRFQSESIGLPIIQRRASWQNYEREFKKAISELRKKDIGAGIFGDIDMQHHRDWVERVCKESGIEPVLPLWLQPREELLNEFIQAGFKTIVVATQSAFLGSEWLGREINNEFIKALKELGTVDLCGEKGEFHTFVYDGPIFKRPVEFISGKEILRDKNWFLQFKLRKE